MRKILQRSLAVSSLLVATVLSAQQPPPTEPTLPDLFDLTSARTFGAFAGATGPDPGGAAGGTVTVVPDLFTGVFSAALPIALPPGRVGLTPKLSIVYRSDSPNGKLGVGWSIDLDAIERRAAKSVDYGANDFVYRTADGASELVSLGGNAYAAKVEGPFSRFRQLAAGGDPPHWQMTTRLGVSFTFGASAESRQESDERPGETFSWLVDKIEDRSGNRILFHYSGDRGEKYLERIDYVEETTDPASTFLYQVLFQWEERADAVDSYLTGFRIRTAKRLRSIAVQARGTAIRSYVFDYTGQGAGYSAMTGRSLLRGFTIVGADGQTTLPRTNFQYQTATREWVRGAWTGATGAPELPVSRNCFPGDFNGDGRMDLACYQKAASWMVSLSTGSGWNSSTWANGYVFPEDVPPPLPPLGPPLPAVPRETVAASRRCLSGDFNGDGRTDLACYTAQGRDWSISLSSGAAWSTSTFHDGFATQPTGMAEGEQERSVVEDCVTGDFTGSGHASIACFGGQWQVMSFDGSAWTRTAWTGGFTTPPFAQSCMTGDFNGDAKTDMLCYADGHWQVELAGAGGWTRQAWQKPSGIVTIGQCLPGDFNGDGKADLACSLDRSATWQVELSTGRDFDLAAWPDGARPLAQRMAILGQCLEGDFNADGLTDFACHGGAGNRWQVTFSTGSGWSTARYDDGYEPEPMGLTVDESALPGGPTPIPQVDASIGSRCFSGDVSGDGKTDVLCWTGGGWRISVAAGPVPDLLSGMDGSLGAHIRVSYAPSTATLDPHLPMVRQVVSRVVSGDGRAADSTTDYEYSGGFFHFAARELRGFAWARERRPDAGGGRALVQTFFHQGADLGPATNDPTSATSPMKGKAYRVLVSDDQGRDYSESLILYAPSPAGAAFAFNPPARVQLTTRGRPGAPDLTTAIEYDYDAFGNVVTERRKGDVTTPADDVVIARTYAVNSSDWIVGLMKSETTWQGSTSGVKLAQKTFFYDGATDCTQAAASQLPTRGLLTRVSFRLDNQRSTEQRMAYDARGNLKCLRVGDATTTYEYDPTGTFLLKSTNALGHVVASRYNGVGEPLGAGRPFGQLAAETDPNGGVRALDYDTLGRLIQVRQPDGGVTRFTYEEIGTADQHVTVTADPATTEWQYFDGYGRVYLRKHLGPESKVVVTETRFDAAGRQTLETMPRWEDDPTPPPARTRTYDPLGRLLTSEEPDGSTARSCYGPGVMVSLDANGHRRRLRSDGEGRVVQIEEYEGTFASCELWETLPGPPPIRPYATTTYAYDGLGDLVEVVDAKGNRTTMKYDGLGQRTRLQDPDVGVVRYSYDPSGNLIEQAGARTRVLLRYDLLGRLVQKDYGQAKPLGQGDAVYSYDDPGTRGIGRIRQVVDRSGSTRFAYDSGGRLVATTRTVGLRSKTISRDFDAAGRIKSVSYDGGDVVEYRYDGPALSQVEMGGQVLLRLSDFNPAEQPQTAAYGNGVVSSYRFSTPGLSCGPLFRLCEWTVGKPGGAPLLSASYRFDPVGNVLQARRGSTTQDLEYDHLNRLTRVTTSAGAAPASVSYVYDPIGNMTFNSAVGAYSYGSLPHAVTAAGTHTLRYDAAGNLASRDAVTYSFDEENRLRRVDRGGGNFSEFGYDAFGRRVRIRQGFLNGTTIGGSDTIYLGDELACQGDLCTMYVIAAGRRIAARTAEGELFFFHDDLGASSVLVTDAAGNGARESRYAPFGEPAQQGQGAFRDDRKRFAGYEYDDASGLYFMATRFYDPVLGAFISPDSTVPSILDPQSLNRFAYSRQNPSSFVDRDGEGIWFAVIAGAIIGALAAGHSSDWDGNAMFWGALAGAAAGAASFYVAPAVAGAAELGGAGGATAGILGSAAGGAAGGLASAGVYRIGGYDVDPLQSTVVGGIAGGFGGAASEIAGGSPSVGAAVESGVKAEIYQEDPWQAALQGWAGSVAGTIGQSVFAKEESFANYTFDSTDGTAEVIALRPAAGDWKNALWAYGIGDGYSHVLLAVGNGEFYEATPDNGAGRVSGAGVARYSSRQYIKAHLDLNVNAVRSADRAITQRAYLHPYVCSSYVNAISGGLTWGLIPGHVVRTQQGW